MVRKLQNFAIFVNSLGPFATFENLLFIYGDLNLFFIIILNVIPPPRTSSSRIQGVDPTRLAPTPLSETPKRLKA